MSHLLRRHAPISETGWRLIDEEARERLTPGLAARRLVDFSGPHGWECSATNLGRVKPVLDAPDDLEVRQRVVLPLVELRAPFALLREELRAGDRGAEDVDFGPLDAAARRLVTCENTAVFHGWKAAGIQGVTEATPHPVIEHGDDFNEYPAAVVRGVELLLRNGVGGPFGLALGEEDWARVVETAEYGGHPLFDHLREILDDGPLVWSPGVDGAVLVSLRGGDFLFESGQDLAVGYWSHDVANVHLYLEETFSFRVATPEAAVAIR